MPAGPCSFFVGYAKKDSSEPLHLVGGGCWSSGEQQMPYILPEILHVPDALERYPEISHVFYHRLSSGGQGSKGKLAEKTLAAENELLKLTAGTRSRLLWEAYGIEEGKLSMPRPKLIEAAAFAAEQGAILVAADLSRFIRSEAYHRCTNFDAEPTQRELAKLGRLTNGVILATVLHPNATESERHSNATKRTMKCGRPSTIDYKLAMRIFEALGSRGLFSRGWENSIATVARRLGIHPGKIQRLLDSPVPGKEGLRWKDFITPSEAYPELGTTMNFISKP